MKRTLKIVFGIIAVLVGFGFVMPALAQWRQEGAMTGLSVALFLLGAMLTLAGGGAAINNSGCPTAICRSQTSVPKKRA